MTITIVLTSEQLGKAAVVLTDAQLASIDQQRAQSQPQQQPPSTPPSIPAGVRVVPLAWTNVVGVQRIRIAAGEAVAFAITPPVGYSSQGRTCRFAQAPSFGDDYYDRQVCLSDTPGDFSRKLAQGAMTQGQESPVWFSVGGYPRDRYDREDRRSPDLVAGVTYYINVRQVDPARSCQINYALSLI